MTDRINEMFAKRAGRRELRKAAVAMDESGNNTPTLHYRSIVDESTGPSAAKVLAGACFALLGIVAFMIGLSLVATGLGLRVWPGTTGLSACLTSLPLFLATHVLVRS